MAGKKGVELSINFVIVVIISLVMLTFGIKFAKDLVKYADKIKQDEFNKIDIELESLVCEGSDPVCVATARKKINSQKSAYFGVKIWNYGSPSETFSMGVTMSSTCLIKADGSVEKDAAICSNYMAYKIIEPAYTTSFNIAPKQYSKKIIVVNTKNAESGTYILNLEITNNGQKYGATQKLYVEIP